MGAKRIFPLINLGLFSLLTFMVIFDDRLVLHPFLQVAGRLHPVVLHLPIGLAFFMVFAFFFMKDMHTQKKLFPLFLLLSITANMSAIAGLFLASDGDYSSNVLSWHKWLGYGLCMINYLGSLYFARNHFKARAAFIIVIGIGLLTVLTGHFGGVITHGEGFILEPLQEEEVPSSTRFEQEIKPLLAEKCASCHNNRKKKGELSFADSDSILKGGKSGPLWVAGDTVNSLILERIHLPLTEKKHMPPKNKPQLTNREVAVLKQWIAQGADMEEPSAVNGENYKVYDFNPASPATLKALESPFFSIIPVAESSPALEVRFLISAAFDSTDLHKMKKISEQIVSLNLSKMPATDEVFNIISEFKNLEKLNLQGTNITGDGLEALEKCTHLETLILSNTKVGFDNIQKLTGHPTLRNLFLWNTTLNPSQAEELLKQNGLWKIDLGSADIFNEVIALNPPRIDNDKTIMEEGGKVVLSHVIQGVDIRYTTDGKEPDALNGKIYEEPFQVEGFTTIKAKAYKDGWKTSETTEKSFFTSYIKASSVMIYDKPGQQIKKEDAKKITDGSSGDVNDFNDPTWIKFRKRPCEMVFSGFEKRPDHITISYLINVESYIVHPEKVEVWAGDQSGNYRLIRNFKPAMVQPGEKKRITGFDINLSGENFESIKIIVTPLMKLPQWHPGKGDFGWFFTDEVYFY